MTWKIDLSPFLVWKIDISPFSAVVITRHKTRAVAAAALAVAGLTTPPVLAGKYELVKGNGVEVCEVYGRALNAVGKPMPCDREIPAAFPELRKPVWEVADPQKERILIARILNYLQTPRDYRATRPLNPVVPDEKLEGYKPPSRVRLLLAELDIGNNGSNQMVAKFGNPVCPLWDEGGIAVRWNQPILVVDRQHQVVDIERTYPLMQNRGKRYVANADEIQAGYKKKKTPEEIALYKPEFQFKESKYSAGLHENQGYDIVMYKGAVYFDRWDEERRGGSFQSLTVYKTDNQKTSEICRFQFHW